MHKTTASRRIRSAKYSNQKIKFNFYEHIFFLNLI